MRYDKDPKQTKTVHVMLTIKVDANANVKRLLGEIDEQLECAWLLTDGSTDGWQPWEKSGKTEQVAFAGHAQSGDYYAAEKK